MFLIQRIWCLKQKQIYLKPSTKNPVKKLHILYFSKVSTIELIFLYQLQPERQQFQLYIVFTISNTRNLIYIKAQSVKGLRVPLVQSRRVFNLIQTTKLVRQIITKTKQLGQNHFTLVPRLTGQILQNYVFSSAVYNADRFSFYYFSNFLWG